MSAKVDVAVIGAGFSGIGAAVALAQRGHRPTSWCSRQGDGVGGAWHWNTLSGHPASTSRRSATSSPSASARDWSRVYAPGDELKAYAEDCVDHYGLRSRHPAEHRGHRRDLGRGRRTSGAWRSHGGRPLTARHVVGRHRRAHASPSRPAIPGVEDFAGTTMHTARWDDVARPARQAGRGHRHGRLRGAGRPVDRPRRRAADRLPAHADLVPAQARPAAAARGSARLLRRVPGVQRALRLVSQSYVELTFPVGAHYATVVPIVEATERHRPLRSCAGRSATPSCATSSRRATASAASAPASRTTTSARSTGRTSHLETSPITAVTRRPDPDRGRRARAVRRADPGHRLQGLRAGQHAAVPGPRRRRRRPRGVLGGEPLPGLPGRERPAASRTSSRSSGPTATTARRTSR